MKCFLILLLTIVIKEIHSKTAYQGVIIHGPGLRPDNIIMPARYVFLNFSGVKEIIDTPSYINNLQLEISGIGKEHSKCRIWTNKLDRKDGTVIIRYKVYDTCETSNINIFYREKHIGKSPYYVPGPIIPDQCNCPINLDTWLQQYGCNGDYSKIHSDLNTFSELNMELMMPKIISRLHIPEANSFCHYVVKNNKIHRNCYGKHIGFNMFSDSILLSLTRKVLLPDMEFVVNLGDWPLSRKHLEPLPIFSWCGNDENYDIVMPTYDITESSLENMGRVTLDMLSVQGNVGLPWSERQPKAFWRGRDSNTHRLDLIDIAREHPDLINASMTNFFFFTDKKEKYGPKQPQISFFKFFDYKYQINIDGTVAAYRLPYLLAGGGLVFKQHSLYKEHFYENIKEWQHYVPIKRDLSDLVEKIQWAIKNEERAKEIAENGQKFANENLLPQHIFCYHVVLFSEWSKRLTGEVTVQNDMTPVNQEEADCFCPQINTKDEL